VHDEIGYQKESGPSGFTRTRNNAGGIEAAFPMPGNPRARLSEADLHPATAADSRGLRHPRTCEGCLRTFRRVRGAGRRVAGEAMVALTLARCALDKFGGDSLKETKR